MLDETLFREGHPDELFFNVECPNCGMSEDYVIWRDTIILNPETNRYHCIVECPNCTHEFEVNLSP